MPNRQSVLGMLCAMAFITYLDRLCLSVAGPRMQAELNIGAAEWGWVTAAFALAYALFEVPSGLWGDRHGARASLARIVVWWSAFTALTGAVSGLGPLLAIRFLFGAGEAGAFPIASIAISRHFPEAARAKAFGWIWMTSQLGGAAAPLLTVPLQMQFGWRISFFVFGAAGLLWSSGWFLWYRDPPASQPQPQRRPAAWLGLLRSRTVRAIMGIGFCYVFAQYFFIAWLHTFLVKGRGFTEADLYYSPAPFLLGAAGNLAGGALSDRAVSRFGLRWGRRAIGVAALGASAAFLLAAVFVEHKASLLLLLSLSYAGTTLQQPSVWAACVDTGGPQSGAVSALMNTAAQLGSMLLSLCVGAIVTRWGSYDLALAPLVVALAAGAALWLLVEPPFTAAPKTA